MIGDPLVRRFLAGLEELLDTRPGISRSRAEAAWQRDEMDRHPLERLEPWPGLDEPHFPAGAPIRPGDVRKRPVFGK